MSSKLFEKPDDAAERAFRRAQELKVRVSIAIADEHGDLVFLKRMEGSPALSPRIATGKAAAAALFQRKTAELEETSRQKPSFYSGITTMTGGYLLFGRGGIPVLSGGIFIGAIGVSGATSEQDEDVAMAAAKAFE